MSIPNIPSIDEIAIDPDLLKGLELSSIEKLLFDIKSREIVLKAVKAAISAELESRYDAAIKAAYLAAGKDTGTVHVSADGYDLECDRTKKVEWDQAQLASIEKTIRVEWEEDPADYLKVTRAVDERAYQGWPSKLRELFAPARTVKPGSLSLKIVRKEAA